MTTTPAGAPPRPAPPQSPRDREQAEAWLQASVAAVTREGGEPDGEHALARKLASQMSETGTSACPEPYDDDLLAAITEDWNPAEVGQEDTVRSLVSRAVDAGIIGTDGGL